MSLEKNITDITGILEREIRSFEKILELLILEEKCLVECDVVALADILARQEDIFSSIACLEKSRNELLDKAAEKLGVSSEDVNVSMLKEHVDGTTKQALTEAGHVLSSLNEQIQRKKATNTMLINQSIMFVESDIRTILNAINQNEPDTAYTAQAETAMASQGVCIDERL